MSSGSWGIVMLFAAMFSGACGAQAVDARRMGFETKASSFSSVSVTVRNGTATSQASSVSESSSLNSNDIVTRIIDAFSHVENGANVTTEAQLVAKAIGKTLATAFTEARTKVNVTGEGFAEANAYGNAEALGHATAEAIVHGITEAANYDQRSFSMVNITALSSEITRGIASVSSSISSTDGAKEEVKKKIAVATARPIAIVIADVLTEVKNGVANVQSSFTVVGNMGGAPVTETSMTECDINCPEPRPTVATENSSSWVVDKIRSAVSGAVMEAVSSSSGTNLSDGNAFAFAFSFAGVGVKVSGQGFVPGEGSGERQKVANITAKGIALALAGIQDRNVTESVAKVKVLVDPVSNIGGGIRDSTSSEASVEPIAHVLAGVLKAAQTGETVSKSVASASGTSNSETSVHQDRSVGGNSHHGNVSYAEDGVGPVPSQGADVKRPGTETGSNTGGGGHDEGMIPEDSEINTYSESCICFYAVRYEPFAVCGEHREPTVCNRGYGVYPSMEECCKKGEAFKDGCNPPPEECYVAEDYTLRTCRRDDTKCLQGSNMWGSMEECCRPEAAFTDGCDDQVNHCGKKCWAARGNFPIKSCYETTGICSRGWGVWESESACCAKGGAFEDGCDAPLPTPCWVRDMYHPIRLCRKDETIGTCYRGWGTYASEEECCSPGASFPEGCSKWIATMAVPSG